MLFLGSQSRPAHDFQARIWLLSLSGASQEKELAVQIWSSTVEVSRVTPDTLWCLKGPKQLFLMAMEKGPFLSRPESLLRCARSVSAVSLLPVRLYYYYWEQYLTHWLCWSSEDRIWCHLSPGLCINSKCCFTSSNDYWALCKKWLSKKKL